MSLSFELSIEVSEPYNFNKDSLNQIEHNPWVKNQWPLVYFLQNESEKIAYVGESTNAASRIRNHLANPKKATIFNKVSIIGSDKFNKSATLDIESALIQYITAEGTFKLQNGNYGLVNHTYYQKDLYKDLFIEIWRKLIERKIVSKSLSAIENSELFKYSPYKALSEDQYNSVIEILNALSFGESTKIFISGSAGTGKTIVATYLMKLLHSDLSYIDQEDLNKEELFEVKLIEAFQRRYPNAKIGLVVAMSSLRQSLENVFKKVPGLSASMIMGPSDTFELGEKYDLLIVDEAHRLRQYKNISWMGVFRQNNQKLGLDDSGDELDWILANSRNQIFFYDPAQSIKPSDIDAVKFTRLLNDTKTIKISLTSQMRVRGGEDYITFVDHLVNAKLRPRQFFNHKDYDLVVFDSLKDLYDELSKKEKAHGLCRLVAGYSWPWLSKENKNATDIKIESLELQWNQTDKDWIHSPNAFAEVGCIHTTQGYDLNYTGIILGEEISYNKENNTIVIDPTKYHDKNGKRGIKDNDTLRSYIINIYKTIMYRGIIGTYLYACDKNLREYFKKHIQTYEKPLPFRILPFESVRPYVNAVPLYDIQAAAGSFSGLQKQEDLQWVELPGNIAAREGYFVCKVVGESMNRKIPNGSWCLFASDEGGSRDGKIVLVECTGIQDADFGSGYTVKEYHSIKSYNNESWKHENIVLKPLSDNSSFNDIKIEGDELFNFKVRGIFKCVL